MSSLAPPPGAMPPSGEFGPSPNAGGPQGGQGPTLPAPAQPPSPGAMQDVSDIMHIVNAVKSIAERHPQAVPVAKQINDLVQQLQMKIVQALPPQEVAAPPV
jgi:hypothetical protein